MGCSSLNIDGVSKRVVYSESVKKMLQNGIEKSYFSDGLLQQSTGYQAKLNLTVFSESAQCLHGINLPGFRAITDTDRGNSE